MSWHKRKQYKCNKDKKIFERLSDAYVSTVKIAFPLKLPFKSLQADVHSTPLGQGVGKKHLGCAMFIPIQAGGRHIVPPTGFFPAVPKRFIVD